MHNNILSTACYHTIPQNEVNVNTAFCGIFAQNGQCCCMLSNGDAMYKRIRDLREDADLTQRQVADYLQRSQQVYSNYELGQRDIPTDVLMRLAELYHTSTDYILGRTDVKKAYPGAKHKEALHSP
ncbi:MAG: helix-turn-helix domain-containing protein [Oscillospiraceae bacterium]